MAFPSDLLRLSELIADKVVGLIFKTADTGPRVVIRQDPTAAGGFGTGTGIVEFFTGLETVDSHKGFVRCEVMADGGTKLSIQAPTSPDGVGGPFPAPLLEMIHAVFDPTTTGFVLWSPVQIGDYLKDGFGHRLAAWNFGRFQGNANGAGDVTIVHNLGISPDTIQLQNNRGNVAQVYSVRSNNAFDMLVSVRDGGGAPVPGGAAVDLFWEVKAK